jgi:hypothetical protein
MVLDWKENIFIVLLLFSGSLVFGQVNMEVIYIGLKTGVGGAFKNENYTFSNQYYKLEFN